MYAPARGPVCVPNDIKTAGRRFMNTRTFAMLFGIVFLIVGAGGFIPGLTDMNHMGHPADAAVTMKSFFGYELKLFPVTLLHSVVHILFGIWGILAARSLGGARGYF